MAVSGQGSLVSEVEQGIARLLQEWYNGLPSEMHWGSKDSNPLALTLHITFKCVFPS